MTNEEYNKKPINQPEETPNSNTDNKTNDPDQEMEKTQDPTGFTERYWSEKRARLKEKYPALTDEDLDYQLSKHDSFVTNLRTKLGKTPGEFNNLLDEL